jgi:Trk-type K+ transport system membrane component
MSAGSVSYEMPFLEKWIFILLMWCGRREVIPVVMFMIPFFRGPE